MGWVIHGTEHLVNDWTSCNRFASVLFPCFAFSCLSAIMSVKVKQADEDKGWGRMTKWENKKIKKNHCKESNYILLKCSQRRRKLHSQNVNLFVKDCHLSSSGSLFWSFHCFNLDSSTVVSFDIILIRAVTSFASSLCFFASFLPSFFLLAFCCCWCWPFSYFIITIILSFILYYYLAWKDCLAVNHFQWMMSKKSAVENKFLSNVLYYLLLLSSSQARDLKQSDTVLGLTLRLSDMLPLTGSCLSLSFLVDQRSVSVSVSLDSFKFTNKKLKRFRLMSKSLLWLSL